MKKLIFILFCFPLMLFSQDEVKANLYEVVNITVKAGQEEGFEAAIKSHNEKFHGEGLYSARLFYNLNGPIGGTYSWIMGPSNWTAQDTRPGEGAHDDDWDKVDAFVESYASPEYWTVDADLTQVPSDAAISKRLIWMYDIKSGQGARWAELVGKVKEVYAAKRADETFIVAWNNFSNDEGKDAAVIFAFDKWAWMDRNSNFSKQYEEVHGPGTWHNFLNDFSDTVKSRVDWIRAQVE